MLFATFQFRPLLLWLAILPVLGSHSRLSFHQDNKLEKEPQIFMHPYLPYRECGRLSREAYHRINGNVTDLTKNPSFVFLHLRVHPIAGSAKWVGCGGTLIANDLVLTATSCIKGRGRDGLIAGYAIHSDTYSPHHEDMPGMKIEIDRVCSAPDFKLAHHTYNKDFSVLKLKGKFSWDRKTQPACIALEGVEPGKLANVVGLGYQAKFKHIKESGEIETITSRSKQLRYTPMTIEECASPYLNQNLICGYSNIKHEGAPARVSGTTQISTCSSTRVLTNFHSKPTKEDEGGPLYRVINAGYYVYGVISPRSEQEPCTFMSRPIILAQNITNMEKDLKNIVDECSKDRS